MIGQRSPLTGRTRVDLRRSLPPWLILLLGAAIAVGVALLAWWVGRDDPAPTWITERLVPALGWVYIALALVALVSWWRRRAHGRAEER